MHRIHSWRVLLVSLLFASSGILVHAQGTLPALTVGSRIVVGYAPAYDGIGWSFVPTTDILVTGIAASASEMTFWQDSPQPLATFAVSSSSWPNARTGIQNFDQVTPLLLFAGQRYFVSCQMPQFSDTTFFYAYEHQPEPGASDFQVSPYLGAFTSYYLTKDGSWLPSATPPTSSSSVLLLGPNFQFQVVPEPATSTLLLVGTAAFFCSGLLRRPRF